MLTAVRLGRPRLLLSGMRSLTSFTGARIFATGRIMYGSPIAVPATKKKTATKTRKATKKAATKVTKKKTTAKKPTKTRAKKEATPIPAVSADDVPQAKVETAPPDQKITDQMRDQIRLFWSGRQPRSSLGYVVQYVTDMARARKFYEKVLGFSVRGPENPFWLEFHTGTTALALHATSDTVPDRKPTGTSVMKGGESCASWFVEDISKTVEEVKKHGGKVLSPPVQEEWGGVRGVFADSEGCVFQVVELKPAQHASFKSMQW